MFGVHITRHTETEGAGDGGERKKKKNRSISTKKGRMREKKGEKHKLKAGVCCDISLRDIVCERSGDGGNLRDGWHLAGSPADLLS